MKQELNVIVHNKPSKEKANEMINKLCKILETLTLEEIGEN